MILKHTHINSEARIQLKRKRIKRLKVFIDEHKKVNM